MHKALPRYTSAGLAKIITQLEEWRAAAQDSLDNEEGRDNPNDERVERYETRIDALETAIDALQGVE